MELLQARDEHGYVFRVDLRLRPASEVTPIALPVEAAINVIEAWVRERNNAQPTKETIEARVAESA